MMMPKLNRTLKARRIAILTLMCSAGWILGAVSNGAAMDTDLRAGVYTDSEAIGVGAGLLTPVGSSSRWFFNPNVEIGFGDEENLIGVNGDFHYDFYNSGNSGMSAWFGGGPAILMTNPDNGDSQTDLGLNVLTGLGGTSGAVRPFAQVKGIITDESQVVLQGGIRF
jgi:hypothetical protein